LVLLKNQIRDQLHKMGIEHSTIEFELPTEACVLENCWYFSSVFVFSIILLIIFDEPVKCN